MNAWAARQTHTHFIVTQIPPEREAFLQQQGRDWSTCPPKNDLTSLGSAERPARFFPNMLVNISRRSAKTPAKISKHFAEIHCQNPTMQKTTKNAFVFSVFSFFHFISADISANITGDISTGDISVILPHKSCISADILALVSANGFGDRLASEGGENGDGRGQERAGESSKMGWGKAVRVRERDGGGRGL